MGQSKYLCLGERKGFCLWGVNGKRWENWNVWLPSGRQAPLCAAGLRADVATSERPSLATLPEDRPSTLTVLLPGSCFWWRLITTLHICLLVHYLIGKNWWEQRLVGFCFRFYFIFGCAGSLLLGDGFSSCGAWASRCGVLLWSLGSSVRELQ